MNVVLVMFRENGERRSFSLTRDVTVIGRREDADFRIPLSDVSRKHSRLIKDGDILLIEDLGSANGTYHNGQRVQEAEVAPGDTLQIGPVQFIVQIDGVPSEEELMGEAPSAAATQMSSRAADRPTAPPPPPLPPALAAENPDDLEVIEDTSELIEVETETDSSIPPSPSFDITDEIDDSPAPDADVIIDLNQPEESEKH